MERAVHHQMRGMVADRRLPSPPPRRRRRRGRGRCRRAAPRRRRPGQAVEQFRLEHREGEDVGRLVLAAPGGVERADLGVVGELDRDFDAEADRSARRDGSRDGGGHGVGGDLGQAVLLSQSPERRIRRGSSDPPLHLQGERRTMSAWLEWASREGSSAEATRSRFPRNRGEDQGWHPHCAFPS